MKTLAPTALARPREVSPACPRALIDEVRPRMTGDRARLVTALLLVALMLCASTLASAQNIVRLSPTTQAVATSDPTLSIDLEIDFAQATVGGGVEITYDAARLKFDAFTFSGDPNFGLMGPAPGETLQPLVVGFGWLSFNPPFGVTGFHTIGTLTFVPLAEGQAIVQTGPSLISPGQFFGPDTPSPLASDFEAASVHVVPEPTLSVALCSGVVGLSSLVTRRRRVQRGA